MIGDDNKSTRSQKRRGTKESTSGAPPDEAAGPATNQDGCHCQQDIHHKLDKIIASLDSMGSRLSALEGKFHEMSAKVDVHDKIISDLKVASEFAGKKNRDLVATINNRCDGNYRYIDRLTSQIEDLQNRSRRNNIIIHGIPEGAEGDKTCEEFVSDFLTNHMKLEGAADVEIERAHRTSAYKHTHPSVINPTRNDSTETKANP